MIDKKLEKKLTMAAQAKSDNLNNQLAIYNNWTEYTKDIVVNQNWLGPSKVAAYVINNCSPDDCIADIGCGTGITGALLTLSGYRNVDGYDVVNDYIDVSKKFYNKTAYCNILDTPLPIRYDIVLASGLFNFHCLTAAPAKNIYNSTKESGCFIMINPAGASKYLETSGWLDQKYFDIVKTIGPYTGRKESNTKSYKYETNILKRRTIL